MMRKGLKKRIIKGKKQSIATLMIMKVVRDDFDDEQKLHLKIEGKRRRKAKHDSFNVDEKKIEEIREKRKESYI